ncbi:hypothetical protein N9B82_00530 [Saprospiraceae bacterium]|nr:hypothetical protein [Saprospiraceae bacterium]
MKEFNFNSAISTLLFLFVLSIFFTACSKEENTKLYETEITPDLKFVGFVDDEYVEKELERMDDAEFLDGENPNNTPTFDCRALRRLTDHAGSPDLDNVPFYQNAFSSDLVRQNGICNIPNSVNQPCLFVGTFGINNFGNESGNYRVIIGNRIYNIGNVTGSFSFQYGGLLPGGIPIGIPCAGNDINMFYQAEDETTPGNWITVAELRLRCTNCIDTPF